MSHLHSIPSCSFTSGIRKLLVQWVAHEQFNIISVEVIQWVAQHLAIVSMEIPLHHCWSLAAHQADIDSCAFAMSLEKILIRTTHLYMLTLVVHLYLYHE
eukprot:c22092_g1_i1 orf=904-1203(+)